MNNKKESTMYQLMKLSATHDDDGMDEMDAIAYYAQDNNDFVAEYKSKYTDLKTSTKDDW